MATQTIDIVGGQAVGDSIPEFCRTSFYMIVSGIIRRAAVILFAFSGAIANADSFKVSKVSWAGDGLRVEVKTDLPDGSEVNLCITDDKNGFNCISDTKSFTANGGRFLVGGFATDLNDEPFRPGHYWVSIAKGTDILPRVAVLPITVPKHKSKTVASEATKVGTEQDRDSAASSGPTFNVSASWVDDILRITGKTDLADGTWLNIAIVDSDGTLVADEGFICAQVQGGRFVVEGFTKNGTEPLPPGRYKLSVEAQNPVQSGAFSVEKPMTITKRPKFTKSRLAEVRAINVANYARAGGNESAANSLSDVSDFQRGESDAQLRHGAIKNMLDKFTAEGVVRFDCEEGKAWIDPTVWEACNAEDKETLARAVYENCSFQSIDIYDAQSAKKLARYGSVVGFRVY